MPDPSPDSPEVLVIGESLTDVVRTATGDDELPGGSPMNVAVGVARLGVSTLLYTQLGDDVRGERIRAHLASAGVEVVTGGDAGRTSSAIAQIGADGAARYTFDLAWSVPPLPLPEGVRLVHTGSIAAFLEPGAHAVLEMLTAARDRGALITFDPNIRPALMPDRESALARFRALARLATVVKLSDEDAAWLYPGTPLDDVAQAITGLGPATAIITMGGHGALIRTYGHTQRLPGRSVDVADTIGAGDSFMSAIVARMITVTADHPAGLTQTLTGPEWIDAAGRALVAASITVSREGANPPTSAELETVLATVTLPAIDRGYPKRDPGDAWVTGPGGEKFWGRFGAAGVLIHDPARGVLLQHRVAWSHFGGTWGIPGGALQQGETAEAGALREAHEEAGVPLDAVRVVGRTVLDLGFWSYTTVVAETTRPFEAAATDLESIELAWVPVERVDTLNLHPKFAESWPRLRAILDSSDHTDHAAAERHTPEPRTR